MTKIRFAILAGVSTDAQAREDKQSIPDQIRFCRDRIKQLGGIETTEPFVMDGYSRTGYDSLEVAMQEIPPLGHAIRAAHADQYDVLIMDNFDRLGDLGFIVKTRFKRLRKQLYSARQSGKVVKPDEYDPYSSDDTDMAMFAQQIIQTYRINKLRRGWNIGVPDRAASGLHPLSIAFGYKAAGRNEPAVQIKRETDLILRMKDMYLKGRTLIEICNMANASGVKPRRSQIWQRAVVSRILLNPYYVGITIFGRYKTVEGKRIPQPPSTWKRGKGKHKPLWDEKTYNAILAEHERRESLRARGDRYPLTGVLTCSVCKTPVHRHGKKYIYLNCKAGHSHIAMRYDQALEIVATAVVKALRAYKDNPAKIESADKYDQRIAEQHALRKRVQEAFERGKIYTEEEAHQKIVAIETEIDRLIRARDRTIHQHAKKEALLKFANQDLDRLHTWITGDDPHTVNLFLTNLCETIYITPQGKARVQWRD